MRLIAERVCHSYRETPVLRGASFALAAGERVAILGESGAGKSSLLRLLTGLETPYSGSVRIETIDGSRSVLRELVTYVPQESCLLPHLSILENIALPLRVRRGLGRRAAQEAAEAIASDLGLQPAVHRFPAQLSGGQAARAQLARALLLASPFLLLDEITAHLDDGSAERARSAIEKYSTSSFHAESSPGRGDRQGLVLVTHDLPFARQVCSRFLILENGLLHELEKPGDEALQQVPRSISAASR